MSFYREKILPHLVDRACGSQGMVRWRERAVEGLSGTVVEIGFGSGLNVPVYPPEVETVFAVEPAELARRLAHERIQRSHADVKHVGLHGESLPLEVDSCDGALSTFTLCTIPDVETALGELRRVLRPGGRFNFLEHGLAPDDRVARWQRRFEPAQKILADGCHLTRDPTELVAAAGFEVQSSTSRYAQGPRPWVYFTEGVAVNPD